jgi:hypothetical protein
MNPARLLPTLKTLSWKPTLLVLALLLLGSLSSCAYPDFGYGGAVVVGDDDDDFGYPGDYFEPYGYEYGGWGGGYRVGPPMGGDRRRMERPSRPYRSAPPSHRMPSIPSRPRGRR